MRDALHFSAVPPRRCKRPLRLYVSQIWPGLAELLAESYCLPHDTRREFKAAYVCFAWRAHRSCWR